MPKCAFLTFLRVKNIQVPEGGPEGPVQAARRPRGGLSERSHTNALQHNLTGYTGSVILDAPGQARSPESQNRLFKLQEA
ncbi:DNA-directed RNA polymerase III subunit Rpc34 [Aspergillus luchuensis]|uniref:DNA-directed RNA polymerase III subunit Rpc34 n=1 Tax=Aspergillus kawachii TaxID=1069201 RepID=A0A146F853_ASPKA|nr:DNA-directed RNA polymerase III subunit Rpc34 [Aspergillus luchuensis]